MCFSSSVPKVTPPPPPPPPPVQMTKRIQPATRSGGTSSSYKKRGTYALRTDLMVGTGGDSGVGVNLAT